MSCQKVSIIMGIYNCQNTLNEAIQSILSQTYQNWEFIICDDCSTDNTYEIAERYAELYPDKITLIRNSENLKLASTLNKCLKIVTGHYIARMDGDDISLPQRLEKQVEFLNDHREYDLVGTQMISFDESGDVGVKFISEKPNKYHLGLTTPFAHATIMARKYVYDRLNGYRIAKEIRRCEDVDLWFRFFYEGFTGYNLQIPLYKVRETVDDFKRRSFTHGVDTVKICFTGYKMLNYPKRYYLFLLKPLIVSLMPAVMMKRLHNLKDKKNKCRSV